MKLPHFIGVPLVIIGGICCIVSYRASSLKASLELGEKVCAELYFK